VKFETIYVDMDGVLFDFVTPAVMLHGRPDLLEPGKWPKGQYSMEAALGISREHFWRVIHDQGSAFWANLPAFAWLEELLGECHNMAERVVLLSTPSDHPSSSAGKHECINKYFGWGFQNYNLTPNKSDLAKPGRLLIDDYSRNCDEWTAAGGQALLFPEAWNHGTGDFNTVLDALAVM